MFLPLVLNEFNKSLRRLRTMELTGKVAVITGGSSGIGLAAVKTLAEQGAYVVSLARDEKNLIAAIDSVHPDFRQNVIGIPTDVRNEASVRYTIAQAVSEYGQIDILINAAGVSMRGKQLVQEIDLEEWNRIMETNLTGTFLMCREVLSQMTERNSGYIINILSTAAFQASGGRQYLFGFQIRRQSFDGSHDFRQSEYGNSRFFDQSGGGQYKYLEPQNKARLSGKKRNDA
jgi:NAD(P)-dependent dehydrogenase (short-subunit alcohol dehydrogenase family)